MNIFDVIIILFILSGAVVGFKRGLTRELVSLVSFFAIVILAFMLKNPISIFLYEHLPFFKFGGILKGVTVLNIALYEIIAFLIMVIILSVIFKILAIITNLFEKILKMTIILSIPSKIAGAVVGIIESYIWVFIVLYILSFPIFNIGILNESKYKNNILNNTPLLSGFIEPTMKVLDEFGDLKNKYESTENASEFNRETLDLFLKYDVVTVESVDKLIENDKLKIDNVEEILNKYRGE